MDIEKTRYRYLAVLYLFSLFGDIFLRLHLREPMLHWTQRKAKKSEDSSLIHIKYCIKIDQSLATQIIK